MAELFSFRLKVPSIVRIWLHANWHLFDDLEAVTLQTDYFLRIIRQQPDFLYAQIHENLGAQAVFAEIHRITQLPVRLDGVVASFLQFISLYFGRQTDPPSFLAHVNNNSLLRLRDVSHGLMQLQPAVASTRSKHIARQAFAMDANE